VLEDAPAGVRAARAAGMRVIGVTTTLSRAEMDAEAPDAVFEEVGRISVADITGLVERGAQPVTAQQLGVPGA
jgi:beta-phosphoglucomutase-like phosphatase (HAD superfamily)